mgnify:CR=1 FL=1
MPATILWFRSDLRLDDNSALAAAITQGEPVIPIYIWDNRPQRPWPLGEASRWWLHYALEDLDAQLRKVGSRLIIRAGDPQLILEEVLHKTKASHLFWNRQYEPAAIARDKKLKAHFTKSGITVESFNSSLLHEPWEVQNKSGKPFQVFTPFWKHCMTLPMPQKVRVSLKKLQVPKSWPKSESLNSLELLPKVKWDRGLAALWEPTRQGAKKRLKDFVDKALGRYSQDRDRPDLKGTSGLSPYLSFGQLGVREIIDALSKAAPGSAIKFISELGWREFAHHLLYHFPSTPEKPLRDEFNRFPWKKDAQLIKAWQSGQTGYPIVDAGMAQLWKTGWMHNRVRMIVASVLVKHFLQPWQVGADWFWDTLVDADLANNTLGWQWVAGCGADASPYFRVFNPVLQGEKFDPEGDYVRRYLPHLAKLPKKYIHSPWKAPVSVLHEADVILDDTYPRPKVGLKEGRKRALDAYEKLKSL